MSHGKGKKWNWTLFYRTTKPEVIIEIIPHNKQRYETVGDWKRNKNGTLIIKVSDMGDKRYAMLVAIHELVETLLCEHDGVKEEDVTAFDIAFEKKRKLGNEDEPGDSQKAPYRKQHAVATIVEKLMCKKLGCNWQKYNDVVNSL